MDHSFTCNYTNACLYLVTRWRLPRLRLQTSNCSLLVIYLPRKDERVSRPSWLTYSGRFRPTHVVVTRQLQVERVSSTIKDQRSTTVPRNQPTAYLAVYDPNMLRCR